MNINLVEINSFFLVAEKPEGLSVHNASEHGEDLVSLLKLQLGKPVFPIHRLDLETSGLITLALNTETAKALSEVFISREIEKKYLCIIKRPLPVSPDWLSWDMPLTDKAEGRKNPQGASIYRKPCLTKYKVLNANSYFSLVDCSILTGRQHQIRKHAALAKSPIVGDDRYGELKYNKKISEIYRVSRLFLHSYYLKFQWKGRSWQFSSNIPPEFDNLLKIQT
jgi:tRNA pseudouridine65 synthase